ncbi:MAG: HD domain-containing phosphohydrolase [bacterium]|nr:HD domain-containing phosphohydrolase [bacterium]
MDYHIKSCKIFAQKINGRKNCSRNIEEVKKISLLISETFHLNEKRRKFIEWAAELMDIGEIIIPESILNKNSTLTKYEREKIDRHPKETIFILKAAPPCNNTNNDYTNLLKIIHHVHERYDGQGYPDRIKHKNIPLESRILSFAIAYVAMKFPTEYRPDPYFVKKIEQEIRENTATQFCPDVALAGLSAIKNMN